MSIPARRDPAGDASQTGDPEDASLVALACAGDHLAFERLVRKHLPWSLALSESLLADADDAEDAVQLAFVSALECLEDCRHPDRFRYWFRTIVRRVALSHAKKRRFVSESCDETLSDDGTDTARQARLNELRAHVRSVLQVMSPLQGRVFILHDMDGYSHGEIAKELGITPGSSRVHLHKARRALRAKLQPLYREGSTDG
jgi:RNA polymerase sigma-70 factor (ECF subfamily)